MFQLGIIVLYWGSHIDLKVTSKAKKTKHVSGIFNET